MNAGMTTVKHQGSVKRRIAMLGPSFIAAVAYLDPGNFATNISAGAEFGYLLVWVVVGANLMAMLIQYLAARIGVLTGRTLPELIAEHSTNPVRIAYWIQAQVVAIATDIAEVVGGAIALQVLTGMPIIWGAIVTVAISTAILVLQGGKTNHRFQQVIITMVVLIAAGILYNVVLAGPSPVETLQGMKPQFAGHESLVLAAGMLGATVMPHAIYIHSALVRDRFGHVGKDQQEEILRATRWDIALSMLLAGSVNGGMLVLAAGALNGVDGTGTLTGAHDAIASVLGSSAGWAFAVALLLSGLASTTVGSYSGTVVFNGLLNMKITPLATRLLTAVPAVVILALGVDPTRALVISQVVLSFGIPLVLIPLISLSANDYVTGRRLNRIVLAVAVLCALLITVLNIALLVATFAS